MAFLSQSLANPMIKYNEYRLEHVKQRVDRLSVHPLDIMITGVTGAGKSTTINALFKKSVAKEGLGTDPETMEVSNYDLNEYIRFWDTPGLGDSIKNDKIHSKKIVDLLKWTYTYSDKEYGFIDLAVVILDGSVRDMGTAFHLLNDVIVPNIQSSRILVAVNQADMAMKGRNWLKSYCRPDGPLFDFLESQTDSVQKRVRQSTGVRILKPVYYSALHGYNIDKFLDMIYDNIPVRRRPI